MPSGQCKPGQGRRRRRQSTPNRAGIILALLGVASVSACQWSPRTVTVDVAALESAPLQFVQQPRRAIVSDRPALAALFQPLGERLGLVEIHTPEQWAALRHIAPQIGSCPPLHRGAAVGIASRVGQPLDGAWPIELMAVRVHDGVGYVSGHFESGTYLADGTVFLEIAQFDALQSVQLVEIDGARYFAR